MFVTLGAGARNADVYGRDDFVVLGLDHRVVHARDGLAAVVQVRDEARPRFLLLRTRGSRHR